MNLTESTLKFLAKTICGDNGLMPRKKGPELMEFFSEYGNDDRKKGDFTNRLKFAESKLKLYNNTLNLTHIIEGSLHLREFFASKISREESVEVINGQLKKDGYEIIKINDQYKVAIPRELMVETENILSHNFITEKIDSCHKQIDNGQFNNAMEAAKDLLVSVMTAIIENDESRSIEAGENFEELYKQVRIKLKFNVMEPQISPFSVVQILSGFESIIEGLSRLSNDPETHFVRPSPKKSWARLMVNSSKTMAEFLLDHRENML